MSRMVLAVVWFAVIGVALYGPSVWATGDYYYYHVWMSDTDNATYPKPGALSDTLWDSFAQWPSWSTTSPTLQTDPTADELLDELTSYQDMVGDDDFFLFYYTGHGREIEITSSEAWTTQPLLGVPAGASTSGITLDVLTGPDYFGGFADNATVVTIFDMCYAGQTLEGAYSFDITGGPVDLRDNTALFAAGQSDEQIGLYAQNYEPWPAGNWDYVSSYFTQGVIEGLQPGADGFALADNSRDGYLYAEELFAYASFRMQEMGGSGGLLWHDIGSQELPLTTTAPTPEPSSLVLLLVGGSSIVGFFRRRKKA